MRQLAARMREATTCPERRGPIHSRRRVARVLVEQAERFGQPDHAGTRVRTGLTQHELAGLTVASPTSVVRALAALRRARRDHDGPLLDRHHRHGGVSRLHALSANRRSRRPVVAPDQMGPGSRCSAIAASYAAGPLGRQPVRRREQQLVDDVEHRGDPRRHLLRRSDRHQLLDHRVGDGGGEIGRRRARLAQVHQHAGVVAEPDGVEVRLVLAQRRRRTGCRPWRRAALLEVVGDDDPQPGRDAEVGPLAGRRVASPRSTAARTSPVIQLGDHTGWPKMPSATSAAISVIVARSGAR